MNRSTSLHHRSSHLGDAIPPAASRPPSDRPPRGWTHIRRRLEGVDGRVREILDRLGPALLRVSLGIVFVWFGMLKVVDASAVGGLVAGTVPFLDASWLVPALGVVEVAMGLAFAAGRFLRLVLPVFALHMAGTFLVLPVLPDVAFEQDNPLMLSVVGEFVVKNLVLLSAGIVVASDATRRRTRARGSGQPRRPERPAERALAERRIASIVAVSALVLAGAACSSEEPSGASASAGGSTIAVRDYKFDPDTTNMDVGEAVTWVWEGGAPHNVVGEGFQSPDQSSGTFEHAFERPGTYEYECTIHPGMDGTVTVTDASA